MDSYLEALQEILAETVRISPRKAEEFFSRKIAGSDPPPKGVLLALLPELIPAFRCAFW